MPQHEGDEDADQWRAWWSWWWASADPAVDAAMRQVFAEVAEAIRERGAFCWASGKCCHFDAYGHRLYVTGLEVAWTLRQLAADGTKQVQPGAEADAQSHAHALVRLPVQQEAGSLAPDDPVGGCPFQVGGRCSIHAVRPLGCRVYFCMAGTEAWQNALYERYLGQLRTLHETHRLPYRYFEWRFALAEAERFGVRQPAAPPRAGSEPPAAE